MFIYIYIMIWDPWLLSTFRQQFFLLRPRGPHLVVVVEFFVLHMLEGLAKDGFDAAVTLLHLKHHSTDGRDLFEIEKNLSEFFWNALNHKIKKLCETGCYPWKFPDLPREHVSAQPYVGSLPCAMWDATAQGLKAALLQRSNVSGFSLAKDQEL